MIRPVRPTDSGDGQVDADVFLASGGGSDLRRRHCCTKEEGDGPGRGFSPVKRSELKDFALDLNTYDPHTSAIVLLLLLPFHFGFVSTSFSLIRAIHLNHNVSSAANERKSRCAAPPVHGLIAIQSTNRKIRQRCSTYLLTHQRHVMSRPIR
jgi:hypothetical protein